MKILLKRPEEPELAALWDEAKRIVEERRLLALMLDSAEHDQTADEAEAELRADGVDVDAFLARVHACICGKRTDCACRMRLPVVDSGVTDEGDDE